MKYSEDSKKVSYMSLSQTVAELGLIIKRVLWFVLKTFWCIFYSRASYNSENTVSKYLLQIKLVGEISIAVDAEFWLTRLPFFAFSMVTRGGIERFIRSWKVSQTIWDGKWLSSHWHHSCWTAFHEIGGWSTTVQWRGWWGGSRWQIDGLGDGHVYG